MKDKLSEVDERKVADIIKEVMPDVFRVSEDPRTEICRVFIGRKVILEITRNEFLELDDPANIPRFLRRLDQRLRLFESGKL